MTDNVQASPSLFQALGDWVEVNQRLLTSIAMMLMGIAQPILLPMLFGPGNPNDFLAKATPILGDILAILGLVASILTALISDTMTARFYLGLWAVVGNFTIIFLVVRLFLH